MKKIIILITLSFFGHLISAQNITGIVLGTDFSFQKLSNNEYSFTFDTRFNIGYGTTCPQLINPEFVIDSNTLYVKGYYDIRGAWPQASCQMLNTVTYNNTIPSNVTQIIMSTNVIKYGTSSADFEIVENVYTKLFNLTLSSLNNLDKKVVFYPNPTKDRINISKDLDFSHISISNNLGQIISVIDKNQSGIYDLQNIKKGVYYITFYSENYKINICKLVIEN